MREAMGRVGEERERDIYICVYRQRKQRVAGSGGVDITGVCKMK